MRTALADAVQRLARAEEAASYGRRAVPSPSGRNCSPRCVPRVTGLLRHGAPAGAAPCPVVAGLAGGGGPSRSRGRGPVVGPSLLGGRRTRTV